MGKNTCRTTNAAVYVTESLLGHTLHVPKSVDTFTHLQVSIVFLTGKTHNAASDLRADGWMD